LAFFAAALSGLMGAGFFFLRVELFLGVLAVRKAASASVRNSSSFSRGIPRCPARVRLGDPADEVGGSRDQLPKCRGAGQHLDGMALSDKTATGQDHESANTSPAVAVEAPQYRQRLSHERIVATLRLRIKMLEDSNRQLR